VNQLFVIGSHSGLFGLPWSALLLALHARAAGGDGISVRRGIGITVVAWVAAHAVKPLDPAFGPVRTAMRLRSSAAQRVPRFLPTRPRGRWPCGRAV